MAEELVKRELPGNIDVGSGLPTTVEIKSPIKEDGTGGEKIKCRLTKTWFQRGSCKGYPTFPLACEKDDDFNQLLQAYGKEEIFAIIQSYFERMAQVAWGFSTTGEEEKNDKGKVVNYNVKEFDVNKYLQAIISGSCRGEKLSELRDKVITLQAQMEEEAEHLDDKNPDPKVIIKIRNLIAKIASLNDQISKRQQRKSPTEDPSDLEEAGESNK